MSLLVSPRQFAQRAELYQQLSQLTAAGIGLPQAIEMQERSPASASFRAPLSIIGAQLAAGATFHDALQATGRWVPEFDKALLLAGEQSGRLPACFRLLAGHYETAAALLRKTISGLIYPALLLHMAILIAPLGDLVRTWNVFAYLLKVSAVLVPLYAGVAALLYAMQGEHAERWRSAVEQVLRWVPVLGKARFNLALARLASALEALLAAGVSIIEAWELAGSASGSPVLRRAVLAWRPDVLGGVTPAEAIRASGAFPEIFCNLYQTGEITGSLEDTLHRVHGFYQEEGSRQLQAVAEWTPKLIYLGVALFVAWQVIRFWSGYFNQINQTIAF